ncbi:hypothetical protein CVT26_008256 [Gymnopilus dilepis]|uniref:OPT family small oligopeptide transporter n=1 Tax=Gymnopilus dilepis TaxID=231916 RepID=A0A409XXB6_9AGAR|nr:hypothetical protein CVT26_008256 [Gymnopilus dilepis]
MFPSPFEWSEEDCRQLSPPLFPSHTPHPPATRDTTPPFPPPLRPQYPSYPISSPYHISINFSQQVLTTQAALEVPEHTYPPVAGSSSSTGHAISRRRHAMSDFDSKEDIVHPLGFALRDAEKSLDETTSTYSGRESGILSDFDPNYDSSSVLEDDSPYPEVRSAVANFDDPEMPASTVRAWTLGLIWAMLLPGMNQFFYLRYPSVLVAQLLLFPVGRAWVRICPRWSILGHELNPGPFTIKEHRRTKALISCTDEHIILPGEQVLVTIMASVGAQSAYATDIVAVQRVFYHQEWSFAYRWMLVMSTQLIGFSMGGVARRFLVAPPSMIWPNTLVSCALFNTLHSQTYAGIGPRDGLSRERFFLYAFVAAIVWYIIPGYLFQALSVFSWVCWIWPDNIKVNQLFGYHSGLGFSLLTLDWNQIAFIGRWAEANVMIGFFFFYWFLTPVLYYKNVWNSQFMPISSNSIYDNTGLQYNITHVYIKQTASFNLTAYQEYSPLYLPPKMKSILYTADHFSAFSFVQLLSPTFGRSMREQPDIHARLMSQYPQVVTFLFACICIKIWPTGMTIWALLVALLIAVVYVIPIGMIQAVTNRQVGLNVITELIVGFMIPVDCRGRTYGYITMAQAMQFTADFKLGHYMKIPPRPMFWCQIVATIVAGTVQLGVQSWDLCDQKQPNNFTCASTRVFGTASVIWGLIGPGRIFTKGQIYYGMPEAVLTLRDVISSDALNAGLSFFFLIGAACPVVLWLFTRRYPSTILNYLKLIFSGVGQIPPATAVNYVPWAIIGFIFQYVVRRKHFSYWAKYNYVLSAALDAGTAVGLILVYFCLQYPLNGSIGLSSIQQWWGNTVYMKTLDWRSTPLRRLPIGQTFGYVSSVS